MVNKDCHHNARSSQLNSMVASKVGITIIYKSYFLKKYIFLPLFDRFLFKWVCARAEKSSVGPWTAVWGPIGIGMLPKLFSRTLISRETFRSIYRGDERYMFQLLYTYYGKYWVWTRFFTPGLIQDFTKLNCSILQKQIVKNSPNFLDTKILSLKYAY